MKYLILSILLSCASQIEPEIENSKHKAFKKDIPKGSILSMKLKNLTGSDIFLDEIVKNYEPNGVLINFFHPECVNCIIEAKEISMKYYEQFLLNNYLVIHVGTYTNISDLKVWRKEHLIIPEIYFDEDGKLFEDLANDYVLPFNLFLNKNLVLIETVTDEISVDEIINKLNNLESI